MQIESCGDPGARSGAGAQGLFQVMPFHFASGEAALDPETNARRGLGYLARSLELAGGRVDLALAGYNGGHSRISQSAELWPDETRRYVAWGSAIYADAASGRSELRRPSTPGCRPVGPACVARHQLLTRKGGLNPPLRFRETLLSLSQRIPRQQLRVLAAGVDSRILRGPGAWGYLAAIELIRVLEIPITALVAAAGVDCRGLTQAEACGYLPQSSGYPDGGFPHGARSRGL